MAVTDVADKIRSICAGLLEVPSDSLEAARYRSELKVAAAQLADRQKEWNKPSEEDVYQAEARQPYRSREKDSSDAFADGLKLFNSKNRDKRKNKQD